MFNVHDDCKGLTTRQIAVRLIENLDTDKCRNIYIICVLDTFLVADKLYCLLRQLQVHILTFKMHI